MSYQFHEVCKLSQSYHAPHFRTNVYPKLCPHPFRRQRLANLQLSTPVSRKGRNAAGQRQQTNTAADGCVTAGKPPRWGELPTYVLAKVCM